MTSFLRNAGAAPSPSLNQAFAECRGAANAGQRSGAAPGERCASREQAGAHAEAWVQVIARLIGARQRKRRMPTAPGPFPVNHYSMTSAAGRKPRPPAQPCRTETWRDRRCANWGKQRGTTAPPDDKSGEKPAAQTMIHQHT